MTSARDNLNTDPTKSNQVSLTYVPGRDWIQTVISRIFEESDSSTPPAGTRKDYHTSRTYDLLGRVTGIQRTGLNGGETALTTTLGYNSLGDQTFAQAPNQHLTADYYTRDIAPSLDLPAVQFMRQAKLEGNAFCHYGSGGMLTYFLYPNVKIFVDSRADLYRRDILRAFMAIRDGRPDQQQLLDQYETDIYFRHWDISALREPEGWTKVYTGPDGEVWLRKRPRNLENLARCKAWHRRFRTPAARSLCSSSITCVSRRTAGNFLQNRRSM